MTTSRIPFSSIQFHNALINDYLSQSSKISSLYEHSPKIDSFKEAIQKKQNFAYRKELHQALSNQYADFTLGEKTQKHLVSLLSENTFTICTAHQLCLLTGPSYFIYKIISTIQLCKQLKEKYPAYHFVPIYWMGSEDHDFEEINHFHLFNKTVEWSSEQTGAIGRFSLTDFDKVIAEISSFFNSPNEIIRSFASIFGKHQHYGKAFQEWILSLFKEEGLLVVEQDDNTLKKVFQEILKKDIETQFTFTVNQQAEQFLNEHYHVQAPSRPSNFFLLDKDKRERVDFENDRFINTQSQEKYTKAELLTLANSHPEKFSPNVILRPLYQECVLPNLAYIGGPGEIAYWLQLKQQFEECEIPLPILLLRDQFLFLPKKSESLLMNYQIELKDIINDFGKTLKRLVKKQSENDLTLSSYQKEIREIFSSIRKQAVDIDFNLKKSVQAEEQKMLNSIHNLEQKMIRAEKRNQETLIKQLEKVNTQIFPNGVFQERFENFLNFYSRMPENYFESLFKNSNVFEQSIKVIWY